MDCYPSTYSQIHFCRAPEAAAQRFGRLSTCVLVGRSNEPAGRCEAVGVVRHESGCQCDDCLYLQLMEDISAATGITDPDELIAIMEERRDEYLDAHPWEILP